LARTPLISDSDRKVSDLYDMIHPNANDTLKLAAAGFVTYNEGDGLPAAIFRRWDRHKCTCIRCRHPARLDRQ
jgi:hypothetical protein